MEVDTLTNEFDLVILFWLLPTDVNPDSLNDVLQQLQTIFDHVYVYNDPDQCLDHLTSLMNHHKVFLVLGTKKLHLIEIFCSLLTLRFIYLTELQEYKLQSQIRGVFPTTQQLVNQLKLDLNILGDYDSHLRISSRGDSTQRQTSTSNLLHGEKDFSWSLLFFYTILDMTRDNDRSNDDLVKECRHIYRNNTEQLKLIDEFVNSYKPSDAIHWYTRDTFLYRLLNMALRTENYLIIFKFRFIIQDIYQQLKTIYRKARNIFRVYRGQRICASELEHLRRSIGHSISLTSFTSTSTNLNIARMFAGNGEDRPIYESVIFEITIDPSEIDDDTLPYADIADVSAHRSEDEILLCMETTMILVDIHTEDALTWIHLRVSHQDISTTMEAKQRLIIPRSTELQDSFGDHLILLNLLFRKGDFSKVPQAAEFFSKNCSPYGNFFESFFQELPNLAYLSHCDNGYHERNMKTFSNLRTLYQSKAKSNDFPDVFNRLLESVVPFLQPIEKLNVQAMHDSLTSLVQTVRDCSGEEIWPFVSRLLAPVLNIENCDDTSQSNSAESSVD
jgi:hypothetical protein